MATIADLRAKQKLVLKDTAGRYVDADRDDFIEEAIRRYSRDRPLIRDDELTGDGSAQEFAVFTEWVKGFSSIMAIEWPVDEVPPQFPNIEDNIRIVQKSGADLFQTIRTTLTSGEKLRILYTAPHKLDASTIFDFDFDAVANLSAACMAAGLAAIYGESLDSTITADAVDHLSKHALFLAQAEALEAKYREHIERGMTETAAFLTGDLDISFSWSRHGDLLFHRNRFR